MNRRDFLATVGVATVVAGCTGSEDDSTLQDTSTPTETETEGPPRTEDLVKVTDHYFEKFAVEDVNTFVTVENISDMELQVEAEISVFEDNMRLANSEGIIWELPSGIAQEISNITLLDLDKPEAVTRYTIEVRGCNADDGSCSEVEPIEMEFSGDEYRGRLEGEWTDV